MTVGADPTAVRTTLDDDQPDPRRARREHVPGRVERVVRAAPAARAERRLPADGDGGRADQRDHVDRRRCASTRSGRPTCCSATTSGAPTGSPRIARARRPCPRRRACRERGIAAAAAARAGRRWRRRRRPDDGSRPRPAAVPARGRRGPRPERHARVRRGELERDRDRLDLRRSRHVQEVPRADRLGGRAGRAVGSPRVHGGRAARRVAAGVPGWRPRATWSSRCRLCRRGRRRLWPASGAT